jgi:hypothetical protein
MTTLLMAALHYGGAAYDGAALCYGAAALWPAYAYYDGPAYDGAVLRRAAIYNGRCTMAALLYRGHCSMAAAAMAAIL